MKAWRLLASLASLLCTLPLAAAADAPTAPGDEADKAYEDMQKTLGRVPEFFKAFPREAIAPAWEEFKALQLGPTSIPAKYKELIGLGVSSQVPCRYCTYYHTQVAAAQGAQDRELKEAIVMAGITRMWSAVLNGLQPEDGAFREEVRQALSYVKSGAGKTAVRPPQCRTADEAYADIKATLGSVPSFMSAFPKVAIAGVWKEFKAIELNPASAVPAKYKELIGLGVAAQIPCKYCVFFHTEVAKLAGATDEEIHEAIAMAAVVRHWSTFLNGAQVDEAGFRRDVDAVLENAKKK